MSFEFSSQPERIRDFKTKLTHDVTRDGVVKTALSLSLILICAVTFSLAQTSRPGSFSADSPNTLKPFFSGNCYACHSSQAKTAGLDLEAIAGRMSVSEDRATWESILAKLKSGQMPPAGMPRPSDVELQAVIKKLEDAVGIGAATVGPDLKPAPVRIDVAIPRRMETTNTVQITTPAHYSMSNYHVTGLSQPGSYHLSYRIPVTGEYVFRITGAGNRPAGSEPTQVEFWVDGKISNTYDVASVGLSGFERRPDFWESRLKLPAGSHEFVVAFPRQFDGLPAKYGGPNPSSLPEPAGRGRGFNPDNSDPQGAAHPNATAGPGRGGQPVDNRPGKIEERRIAAEKAKRQAEHPTWNGLSANEFDIVGPTTTPGLLHRRVNRKSSPATIRTGAASLPA